MRESAQGTWVFWVHASNVARFEQSYRQIAAVAKIPRRDEPESNILQLVYQWLCDKSNGRWLMILDNADNDGIFFNGDNWDESDKQEPLVNFLPQVTQGFVLITSRNCLAARNIAGEDCVIEIQPMNEYESLSLLRAKIRGTQSTNETAVDEKALIHALEYLPLAITQAGSYIANRSPRITVSRYLKLFHESESNQTHLLQHEDAKDLRRDPSIRYAVITTWQLSFEQIRQEQPVATNLLALMSMFDRQGIPEFLVREGDDVLLFEDALAPLISYSLIRSDIERQSFEMHRIVQLSIRAWLKGQGQLDRWAKISRDVMTKAFPNGQYGSWETCERLLPHFNEMVKFAPVTDKEDQVNEARVASRCGLYLQLVGDYYDAESKYRLALESSEKVLGVEDVETVRCVNNLGHILEKRGKYEEAEKTFRRALKDSEKLFGPSHRDTLIIRSNLGSVVYNQGNYSSAEALLKGVLEFGNEILETEDLFTLSLYSSLALVYAAQDKYRDAEILLRITLDGYEQVLGRFHPSTLRTLENLGSVLVKCGKYDEAEAMQRITLKISENLLGAHHPDTLHSENTLGFMLEKQGKYGEAENMYRRSSADSQELLGSEHPHTLGTINNLASVLGHRGKYEEAERLHRRSLQGLEKAIGVKHPSTLNSLTNLAFVLAMQENYEEAETLLRRVLKGYRALHPHTLYIITNLSNVLFSQSKYEEAEAMNRQGIMLSLVFVALFLSGPKSG